MGALALHGLGNPNMVIGKGRNQGLVGDTQDLMMAGDGMELGGNGLGHLA